MIKFKQYSQPCQKFLFHLFIFKEEVKPTTSQCSFQVLNLINLTNVTYPLLHSTLSTEDITDILYSNHCQCVRVVLIGRLPTNPETLRTPIPPRMLEQDNTVELKRHQPYSLSFNTPTVCVCVRDKWMFVTAGAVKPDSVRARVGQGQILTALSKSSICKKKRLLFLLWTIVPASEQHPTVLSISSTLARGYTQSSFQYFQRTRQVSSSNDCFRPFVNSLPLTVAASPRTQTCPIHPSRLNSISLQACNPTLSYQLQAKKQTYPKYSQEFTLPTQLSLREKHED